MLLLRDPPANLKELFGDTVNILYPAPEQRPLIRLTLGLTCPCEFADVSNDNYRCAMAVLLWIEATRRSAFGVSIKRVKFEILPVFPHSTANVRQECRAPNPVILSCARASGLRNLQISAKHECFPDRKQRHQ